MNQEQLRALLKERGRLEMPADYPQTLLAQLHRKQREELLHRSLWRIAADRLGTHFGEHSISTPVYVLGLAALFALGLGIIFWLRPAATGGLHRDDASLTRHTNPATTESTNDPSTINTVKPADLLQVPVDAQKVSFGQ